MWYSVDRQTKMDGFRKIQELEKKRDFFLSIL